MIKSLTAINYLGEAITLDLMNPDASGFEVRYINGLDAGKATLNFSKVATIPGNKFNSATVDGRNVVIGLGLLNSPTVEEARHRAYQYFPRMREVTLIIETDKRRVTTRGFVESNESELFSADTALQISILCEDAYLYDASETSWTKTSFYGTTKLFEFPFSNESLTEKLLEFGSIEGVLSQDVYYDGDAEVGMTITMSFSGPVTNLRFYNDQTNEVISISNSVLTTMLGSGLNQGDRIVVVTNANEKSATLIRNGIRTNILNALGRNIVWPQFRKGLNRMAYSADTGVNDVQITVENQIIYEGV